MRLDIALMVGLGLAMAQPIFSQVEESVSLLTEKVRVGDNQAILDAGKSGDRSLIPYLRTLTKRGTPWAQMALAKLGEPKYLNEILAEIDDPSPEVQDKAIGKLAYVGGKAAFDKLLLLLDDAAPRENPNCIKETTELVKNHPDVEKCGLCCDVIFGTKSSVAILYLSKMVENPPTRLGIAGTEKDIAVWKKWFDEHKYVVE